MTNACILRVLAVVLGASLGTVGSAQGPGVPDFLKRTQGYERFTVRVETADVHTKAYYEAWDSPVPDGAGREMKGKWLLRVKGNKARADYVVGGGPSATPYVQIYDGQKTIDFYISKSKVGGKELMRASEDDKNTVRGNTWRAFGRDESTARFW